MLVTEVTSDKAYFERAFMDGSCSYIIHDIHGDWWVEVSDFNAIEYPGEIELEYLVTDEEQALIKYLIEDHISENNIIEELTDNTEDWMSNENW